MEGDDVKELLQVVCADGIAYIQWRRQTYTSLQNPASLYTSLQGMHDFIADKPRGS